MTDTTTTLLLRAAAERARWLPAAAAEPLADLLTALAADCAAVGTDSPQILAALVNGYAEAVALARILLADDPCTYTPEGAPTRG